MAMTRDKVVTVVAKIFVVASIQKIMLTKFMYKECYSNKYNIYHMRMLFCILHQIQTLVLRI